MFWVLLDFTSLEILGVHCNGACNTRMATAESVVAKGGATRRACEVFIGRLGVGIQAGLDVPVRFEVIKGGVLSGLLKGGRQNPGG